jgi:hypothetical protein
LSNSIGSPDKEFGPLSSAEGIPRAKKINVIQLGVIDACKAMENATKSFIDLCGPKNNILEAVQLLKKSNFTMDERLDILEILETNPSRANFITQLEDPVMIEGYIRRLLKTAPTTNTVAPIALLGSSENDAEEAEK